MKNSKSIFTFYNIRNRLLHTLRNPRFIAHYVSKVYQYSSPSLNNGFLISYPKSGRTWLQRIIVEAAIIEFKIEEPIKDIFNLSNSVANFPRIVATHGGACWEENLRINDTKDIASLSDDLYLTKKVVFMYRDPRDVLVSQYYHMKFRTGITKIQKSDMIHNLVIGLPKQIAFVNKWQTYQESNKYDILSLSYKDLHEDIKAAVNKANEFWGLRLSDTSIEEGIKKSTFKKMKSKESPNSKTPWSYTPNLQNKNSYHARNGKIGDHNSFFDEKELKEINDIMEDTLHPSLKSIWL